MCGIIGGVGPTAHARELNLRSMQHRGPDDCGWQRVGSASLGHTRLSIIDVAGGAQPMTSVDGSATIVFNGEIYNYRDLRDELSQRGHAFARASDTETVLATYREWGVAGFARLRGMYALALADRQSGATVLARDPFGIKPLFVACEGADTLFASEIGALVTMMARTPALDRTSILETLFYRYPIGDHSLYSGIKRLRPGTALTIQPDGRTALTQFADVPAAVENERGNLPRGDRATVRMRVSDTVAHHAIADVSVGCFLSGGLDSSIVASELARISPGRLRTYAVSFQSTKSEQSELPFARLVAGRIGAELTEVSVSADDFAELAPQLSGSANGPFPDPADVAMLKMSLAAARDVKVVLSGEGADEAFAGYPKYAFDRYARYVPDALPGILPTDRLGRAGIALEALGEPDRPTRWMRWFQNADAPQPLVEALRADGADPDRAHSWIADRIAAYPPGWSDLQRMQTLDVESWLPNNLLHRGDYTTMQASLEQRVPYLDIQTTPWAIALSDDAKIAARRGKQALRQAYARDLPPEVISRRKSGFRLPLSDWLRAPGRLRSLVHDHLLAPNAELRQWVSPAHLQDMLEPRRLETTGGAKLAWTALSLELWLLSLGECA